MWAYDEDDATVWLGGVFIDRSFQGRGFGTAAAQAALERFAPRSPRRRVGLTVHPANSSARRFWARLGFVETGEVADGELVAAQIVPAAHDDA